MLKDQTRYSRLANITKMINMKLELHEVLEYVTTAISEEIVQCNYVGIYLPQEDGTFRGYVGKPETINGWTLDTQVIDVENDLLTREVIETKRTIYIPDTAKDQRPNPKVVETFQIKSLLVLPISFDQELYGVVFLFDYGTPMNLTNSEIQSVEAYLNMAAVAIRNANILTQKENLISEKQLLLDVTRDLSLCSSIEESLDKCFFYLGQVFENYKICIHLIDPYIDRIIRPLEFKKGKDLEEWMEIGKRIINLQSYETFFQGITQTKKALLIQDVYADERLNHEVCRYLSIKSLFIIPIVSMGEVLGIIAVIDYEEKGFTNDESQIRLAQSIVDAAASTLSSLLYMKQLENMIDERTKELAVANQKNIDVIESITDGFLTLDKDWNISYLNDHNRLPLNKISKDVIGKNLWDQFPKTVDTVLHREFHRVMSDRIPVHFETQSAYGDQWYEIVAYPYDEGISSLIKDITEKKKYEKELKRLSGLDLIGQMAAGISHEIRNPMTTVRGFLQILNENQELDKYSQYIKLMVEEIDRANSIISEFLSMSNTRTSDLHKLDLNAIIHDMFPLINIDASNQNKYIELDLNDIPPLLLNRNEIRQLLINIYRNGLEAMEEGKVLTIKTYKEENCVVLALQDQGEGIRPEVLEKLGTPFFTTKEKGTGLGLGVCYAIAARHNAKIEIETGPEGTTFFVRFKY
jgi:signal transduction histidine kinase/GAF domain-containing protein